MKTKLLLALLLIQSFSPAFAKEPGVPVMILGSLAGAPTGAIVGGIRGGAVGIKEGTKFTAGILGDENSYIARGFGVLGGVIIAPFAAILGGTKSGYKGIVEGYDRPFHEEAYSLDGTYLTDYRIFE